jgi:hypothetical protein
MQDSWKLSPMAVLVLAFALAFQPLAALADCGDAFGEMPSYEEFKAQEAKREARVKKIRNWFVASTIAATAAVAFLYPWSAEGNTEQSSQNNPTVNNGIWISPFSGEKLDVSRFTAIHGLNYVQLVKHIESLGVVVMHVKEQSSFSALNNVSREDVEFYRAMLALSNQDGDGHTSAFYTQADTIYGKDAKGNIRVRPLLGKHVIVVGSGEGKVDVLQHEYLHYLLKSENAQRNIVDFDGKLLTYENYSLVLLTQLIQQKLAYAQNPSNRDLYINLARTKVELEYFSLRSGLESHNHELTVRFLQLQWAKQTGLPREDYKDIVLNAVILNKNFHERIGKTVEDVQTIVDELRTDTIAFKAVLPILKKFQQDAPAAAKSITQNHETFLELLEPLRDEIDADIERKSSATKATL